MEKIFYDTEFIEGTQKTWWGGKTKPTIDLISIAMVKENGGEYYAISKDFNMKEAWNRYDKKIQYFHGDMRNQFPNGRKYKVYWIRENVLKPIFNYLMRLWAEDETKANQMSTTVNYNPTTQFTFRNFKKLVNKYGRTLKQISLDISLDFITQKSEFYGYYSAFDHVALSWIFGKMINLPKKIPMYTKDLKQILDDKQESREKLKDMLQYSNLYEKYKENEHDALDDARWNRDLYNFLTHGIHSR